MQRKPVPRAAVGIIVLGAAVLGAAVIARHLSGMRGQVLHTLLALGRLRPEAIGLALALSVLSLLINGAVWARLLGHLGYKVGRSVGLAAFLSAGLGGYLVNAAGPAVGCALSLRRHGVCPGRAVLLSLMGSAVGFCAVLVWALVGVLVLARTDLDQALPLLGRHGPLAAAAVLVGLALTMLVVLRALAGAPGARSRLARKLLGEDPPAFGGDGASATGASLRPRHLLALVPLSAAAWLSGVLALYVVLGALQAGRAVNLGDVLGSAALAATLGSLAFFVPDGVGVRDGALVALLAHSTGLPVAQCAAAAIAMRALDPLTKLSLLLAVLGAAHLPLAHPGARRTARRPGAARPSLRLDWWHFRRAGAAPRVARPGRLPRPGGLPASLATPGHARPP